MVLVYAQKKSKRLIYILDFLLTQILGLSYKLTSQREEYEGYPGAKINYSLRSISEKELHIVNIGLLFQMGIKEQSIEVQWQKDLPTFYSTNDNSDINFDVFAASFYLISRYEEYLPYKPDKFGRFPASASLAYQEKFLQIPVVNHYAYLIKDLLKERFPELHFMERKYEFIPTFDIDAAYSMKSKGFVRTIGGFLQSIAKRDFKELNRRFNVVLGKEQDPYDTFDYMIAIQKEYGFDPKYFFLVGDYDEFDKNISLQVNDFRYLIKSVNDYAEVGLHPSYASNYDFERLKMEKNRLKEVLNKAIRISRQHFLKVNIPRTYQQLIELEIQEDYSMGYASEIGFRAGTCTPFYFYDLDYEAQTKLKIVPFSVMDVTLNLYLNYLPDEAVEKCKEIVSELKKVDGKFIILWHNQNLSNEKEWKGWVRVFENIVVNSMS